MSNKSAIYITGHKNPDTDSICCTIAYAHLKQALGENAVGVRIGEINHETEFVLDYFQVDAPPMVYDIRTKVRDIEFDEALTIGTDGVLRDAMDLMREHHAKTVAVTDDENKLLGIVSISDINSTIVTESDEKDQLIAKTPIENFVDILDGRLLYKSEKCHRDGKIFIASSLAAERDAQYYKNRIVITSSRKESQLRAIEAGAAVIISTRASIPQMEVYHKCVEYNCNYIITEKDMYQTAQLVQQSIPVTSIMTTNMATFNFNDYIEDVKLSINRHRHHSYPVIDHTGSMIGFLARYHLFKHNNRKLILVDHNELEQSIIGANQAEIIEIIDHHRIGGLKTMGPVVFRNETVGCCATIVTKMYGEKGVEITPTIAGLLCSAIISDTMYFNSPTCTQEDIDTAHRLAKIAGINLEEYAMQELAASAEVEGKSIEEIVYNDLKVFEIEKFKVALGQINILNMNSIDNIRSDIMEYIEDMARANNFSLCVIIFSKVDASGSYLLYTGPASFLVGNAFSDYSSQKDGYLFLKDVLSRKKQIVPLLTEAARVYNERGM